MHIMIFAEIRSNKIHSSTYELICKARELAKNDGAVSVAIIGPKLDCSADDLFAYGADKIFLTEHASMEEFNQEIAANVLCEILRQQSPDIVLAPATSAGRTVMPAVAAMLRTGLTADCTGLEIDEMTGLLLQTRPAIGGNVMATIKTPEHRPQMATVRPKTFRITQGIPNKSGEIIRPILPDNIFKTSIISLGIEKNDDNNSNIQDKDVVVSGGKGLRRPEGFAKIRELAEILDGAVGASRPTVEAKWIDYAHQVGLSGKAVSPKLYMCAGISGAVQHLAGMMTAGKIVAINKDPEASIFKIADIALCGDLYDIIPRLIDRIKKEKD